MIGSVNRNIFKKILLLWNLFSILIPCSSLLLHMIYLLFSLKTWAHQFIRNERSFSTVFFSHRWESFSSFKKMKPISFVKCWCLKWCNKSICFTKSDVNVEIEYFILCLLISRRCMEWKDTCVIVIVNFMKSCTKFCFLNKKVFNRWTW